MAGGLLPSCNEGAAKQSIIDFVRGTTDHASGDLVPQVCVLPNAARRPNS
jgi:hypothetical protein